MALILVIDDEEPIRIVLRANLEAAGHEVIEAKDGKEGLRLYQKESVDLIICDIIMPEKEGISTILEALESNPVQKVIAMSGGGRDGYLGYLDTAREFGVRHTLQKPFSKTQLIECVDACLQGVP